MKVLSQIAGVFLSRWRLLLTLIGVAVAAIAIAIAAWNLHSLYRSVTFADERERLQRTVDVLSLDKRKLESEVASYKQKFETFKRQTEDNFKRRLKTPQIFDEKPQ